jgi:hypothetical protein
VIVKCGDRAGPGSAPMDAPEKQMSPPARQQLILDQIEQVLQAADPRLKAMFSIFGRLASREAMPATEAMPEGDVTPRKPVWKKVLISALAISLLSVFVFNVVTTSNECPGLSSDQVVASAAVRYAACNHNSTDAWSKGAR